MDAASVEVRVSGTERDVSLGQHDILGDRPVDGVVGHAHPRDAVADRHRPHVGSDRFNAPDGVPPEPDRAVVGDQTQLVYGAGGDEPVDVVDRRGFDSHEHLPGPGYGYRGIDGCGGAVAGGGQNAHDLLQTNARETVARTDR